MKSEEGHVFALYKSCAEMLCAFQFKLQSVISILMQLLVNVVWFGPYNSERSLQDTTIYQVRQCAVNVNNTYIFTWEVRLTCLLTF